MENQKSAKELIIHTLNEKASLKQEVFAITGSVFKTFQEELEQLATEIEPSVQAHDKRVKVDYNSKGNYEAELKFGGDILVFHMHTNIFKFDRSHSVYNHSYVKENELNAYCGLINVYNFLADSFKYNRLNDTGYLVARIFVNRDQHFFVEGKRQMAFLFNDFANESINRQKVREIIESTVLYSLDFDLLTPKYDDVKEVQVFQIQELSNNLKLKTAKRMGFQFQADINSIE